MPHRNGLLDLKDTKREKILELFQLAKSFQNSGHHKESFRGSAILLFLEPSTRTRISFEIACHRTGLIPVVIQGRSATSLEKEESLEDTFLNIAAMGPEVIIVRAGDEYPLSSISPELNVSLINAGWGVKGHPTQALLDAFTLFDKWGDLRNKKLLLIGDVIHSRVAQSHFELAKILGYEVRSFSPPTLRPQSSDLQHFTALKEGLEWCDTVMALRTQKERHQQQFDMNKFNEDWGLNPGNIKYLRKDAFIMHPGPVNWGTELSSSIKTHPQSIILQQVKCGVLLRQALLSMLQEEKW